MIPPLNFIVFTDILILSHIFVKTKQKCKIFYVVQIKVDFLIKNGRISIMNIKTILKENKIKLIEFSQLLGISRPTLNAYISEFEKNNTLQNQTYNEIFKELFSQNISSDEFKEKLKKVAEKFQDENYENFSDENLILMNSIIKKMKNDMFGKKETVVLYKFINSALNLYGKNAPLTAYINYTLYLNGLKDIKKIKPNEKKLISNIFPVMKKYSNSKLEYNEDGFQLFLNRVKEIEKEREKKRREILKKIEEQLEKEIELTGTINQDKLKDIFLKLNNK